MLTSQELKDLSVLSPWRSTLALALDWVLIVTSFALAILIPHPIVYVASAIIIARTQLALGLLMHDATHGRLFNKRRWNNWAAQFFTAGPVFFSFYSYKNNHLIHHQNPLVPSDPDITLTGGYPISKKSLARKLLRDLCGVSYFKFAKYFLYGSHKRRKETNDAKTLEKAQSTKADMPFGVIILSIVAPNFLFFFILWKIGHPLLYFGLWMLPAMTILQVLLRIRGIAEHAGYKPNANQMLNSRTIAPHSWQTFFFAPHNVHYHLEHHQYVSIPFYRLPKVYALLKERGSHPPANVFKNYQDVLRTVIH